MASGERFGTIFDGGTTLGLGPGELLDRFRTRRDEAAFAALVARHGPMVLATCRRILPERADADDAFQATFLILARKAGTVHDADRLAPWLHGVARRVAVRAKVLAARRTAVEGAEQKNVAIAPPSDDLAELRSVLDEELARLPAKYRAPLVLCYLEGLTHDEAAGQLKWPVGTVRSRLAGGRDRLRSRLARRGFAPAVLAVLSPATLPSAAVSRFLQAATVRLVFTYGTKPAASSVAAVLAQGVLTSMLVTQVQTVAVATLALAIPWGALTTAVVAHQQAADSQPASLPQPVPGPDDREARKRDIRRDQERRSALKQEFNILARRLEQLSVDWAQEEERLKKQLAEKEEEIRSVERQLQEKVALLPFDRPAAPTSPAPAPAGSSPELETANARIKALEAEVAARDAKIRDLEGRVSRPVLSRVAEASQPRPDPIPTEPPIPLAPRMAELAQGGPTRQQAGDTPKLDVPAGSSGSGALLGPFQEGQGRSSRIASTKPAAGMWTLEGMPTTVAVVAAARDRITMIDADSQKRVTFHLPSPLTEAIIDPWNTTRLGALVPIPSVGLVGVRMGGPDIRRLGIFDRRTSSWFEHTLTRPITYVIPYIGAKGLVSFRMVSPRQDELVLFDARKQAYLTYPLREPAIDGVLPSNAIDDEVVEWRVGHFLYLYSQVAGRWGVLEVQTPFIYRNQHMPGVDSANVFAQASGPDLTRSGDKLLFKEQDAIHLFDIKTAEWTRIDTRDEK